MFDPFKPVKTRDGRPARILTTDLKGADTLVAAVTMPSGDEDVVLYNSEGRWDELDLVNVPDQRKLYLSLGEAYTRPQYAREQAPKWDVIEVVLEEGNGHEDTPAKVVGVRVVGRDG